jgi:hypothetical protein
MHIPRNLAIKILNIDTQPQPSQKQLLALRSLVMLLCDWGSDLNQ